jgi:hypothetical protein
MTPTHENQNPNIDTAPIPEAVQDESGPALSGLMRTITQWRVKRLEAQIKEMPDDITFYKEVGRDTLAVKDQKAAYDPLKNFNKVHMTRVADIPPKEKKKPEDLPKRARTALQAKAATRASFRLDSTNEQEGVVDLYDSLYPELHLKDRSAKIVARDKSHIILPRGDRRALKNELNQELGSKRMTPQERKGIQAAAKRINKAQRSIRRSSGRIQRSMIGQDLPGHVVKRRLQHKTEKIDKLKSRL